MSPLAPEGWWVCVCVCGRAYMCACACVFVCWGGDVMGLLIDAAMGQKLHRL